MASAGGSTTIRRIADRVLVIFPFEESIYRAARGAGRVRRSSARRSDVDRRAPRERLSCAAQGLTPSAPCVAILPGSRPNEVARILPGSRCERWLVRQRVAGVQFVVARAPHLDDALFRRGRMPSPRTAVVEGDTDTVLASADVALTASGTATVQTALHDTPMVIVYRDVAVVSYQLAAGVW